MINLGDTVKDPISGFEGVAVSSHQYLHGCVRISVQPVVRDDGKLPDTASFDEPQLVVIEASQEKPQPQSQRTGGPEKYPDTPRV